MEDNNLLAEEKELFSEEINKSIEWLIVTMPKGFERKYTIAIVIILLIILFSFYFLIG